MALYKKGESGNPNGRPQGSKNRNAVRQTIGDLLSDRFTIESLSKDLDALEPRDRISALIRLIEFVAPRLKAVEASIESDNDKPSIDLGQLTKDQRAEWYALYDLAKIKPNGQTDEVDQVKTQDHG